MSTFTENRDALFMGEGPDGEPGAPVAPTTTEWVAQRCAILRQFWSWFIYKFQGGDQPNLAVEPYAGWEADPDGRTPEDMIRDGHNSTYP